MSRRITLRRFVMENITEIREYIRSVTGQKRGALSFQEMEDWVLGDGELSNWASSSGVEDI